MAEKTEAEARAERIAGMRELLDFLSAHPDVPLPSFAFERTIIGDDDAVGAAELARVAASLGSEVKQDGEHYETVRTFGAARYRAFYVGRAEMQRYENHMSSYHRQGKAD